MLQNKFGILLKCAMHVHFTKNANDMRCYQVILDMYFYLFIFMNKPFGIEACIKA